MGQIISSSFSGALPLLKSRGHVYVILLLVAAAAGFGLQFLTPMFDAASTTGNMSPQMVHTLLSLYGSFYPALILAGISTYFIIPSAIRTIQPAFGMTIGRFFGLLGTGYAVVLAAEIGLFLLIVPGFWFGVKWSQYIWTYLMRDGEDPLDESWRITTGQFWETFGFFIVIGFIEVVILGVCLGIVAGLAYAMPQGAVVWCPLAFLACLFVVSFAVLAQLRWMLQLRERAGTPAVAAT
jgi:hypothetical protein